MALHSSLVVKVLPHLWCRLLPAISVIAVVFFPARLPQQQPQNNCTGTITIDQDDDIIFPDEFPALTDCVGSCSEDDECLRVSDSNWFPPMLGGGFEMFCGCERAEPNPPNPPLGPEPSCCHVYIYYEWVSDGEGGLELEATDWGAHGSCILADCPVGGTCEFVKVDPFDIIYPFDFVAECD